MNGFFAELRRRNVFRVAGVYAVVGWLIAQIASILETSLGLPDWFDAVAVTLLLLGLPVALLLAWAFEMTPDGMKPTAAVPADQSITRSTGQKLDFVIIGALVLVAGLVGWQMVAAPAPGGQVRAQQSALDDASIAVLPFADMSAEGDQEYFSDGIAEELLNVLAQVPELQVAGRTSAFAFKGRNEDLREIGRILQVSHILEGSVRKAGEKIRITAQLIEADTGYHVWSETYDRDLDDIFAIQDEISAAITAELVPRLTGEAQAVNVARSSDIDAYELYLLARQQERGGTYVDYEKAAETLDKALALDPAYAPALAWRSYYEMMMSDAPGATGTNSRDTAFPRAKALLDRAVAADPASPDVLFALGGYNLFRNDFEKAEQYYRMALEKKPNFNYARNDLGYLYLRRGELDKALAELGKVLAHDPAHTDANTNVVSIHLRRGEVDEARRVLDRWAQISPDAISRLQMEGQYANTTGAYGDSLIIVRQILAKQDNPQARNALPFIQMMLGQYAEGADADTLYVRTVSLSMLGRTEEALAEARSFYKENSDRRDAFYPLLGLLSLTSRWQEVTALYDERFGSVEAFADYFQNPPYEYVAPALVETGHEDAEAMLDAMEAHIAARRANELANEYLDFLEAVLVKARGGDEDRVLTLLESAFERGERLPIIGITPYWADLEDQVRFNALVDRYEAAINEERAKVDLPAMTLPRNTGG